MAPSTSARVSVRALSKRYGAVEAVRSVSFEVNAGEIFGLIGPNGAGKTTTLECILGLRRPDSGAIAIGGFDAIAHPEKAKGITGAQLQGAALPDKITPREALNLFAAFYRSSAEVGDLIGRFDLSTKADAAFDTLSGGQRQRLFLALAFVNNPSLVVLDEPTAGLDPSSRRDLHQSILDMSRSGRTVLLSTHHLDDAQQLCGRVGLLNRGSLLAVGTPAELIAAAAINPRVVVRTSRPLDAARAVSLPGVVGAEQRDGHWHFRTTEVHRTVAGIVQCLVPGDNDLLDLRIQPPSLEDAFIALTGRDAPEPQPSAGRLD